MTFQLAHDGLVREFEFFAPRGWPYWIEQAHEIDARRGLPLIIALHGGGQDPAVFALQWPFFTLQDPTCPNHLPDWDDKFFVLYPFASSTSPKGTCADPGDGTPRRGWNTGFSEEVMPSPDDVSFIMAAVDAVNSMLDGELQRLGIALPAIDEDRRFAFGYSMGGMMAYRIAHEAPDHLAALWVMAGAYGGRAHDGLTETVANDPSGQRGSLSLFAHHGELDTVVPPGSVSAKNTPIASAESRDAYEVAGLPTADAAAYAGSVLPLEGAVQAFVRYNDCLPVARELTGLASLDPNQASSRRLFRRAASPNPSVTVYRDPAMLHVGFSTDPDRYFFAADVWDFFKRHPRPSD